MRWTSKLCWLILPVLILVTAPTARADDTTPTVDARYEGYTGDVVFPESSAAVDWFILVGLGLVGMGVMFIDSRRSHLD